MSIFQAPQAVLTPDANGDLVDVTGFKRAWTLADGTAVIDADAVTGGTQLRTMAELLEAEKPDPVVVQEVRGLDRVVSNFTQNIRIARALYYDAETDTWVSTGAQTFHDNMVTYRSQAQNRRDTVASNIQWPTDSVRHVLLTNGEDPQRIRIDG